MEIIVAMVFMIAIMFFFGIGYFLIKSRENQNMEMVKATKALADANKALSTENKEIANASLLQQSYPWFPSWYGKNPYYGWGSGWRGRRRH